MTVLERVGFDTEAGIAATGGDDAFYLELVRDFRRDYLENVLIIRHETDSAVLERVAHDLKGVLRMLGEARVAQMAEEWEASLRCKADCVREQAMVCDALERLSRDLVVSTR